MTHSIKITVLNAPEKGKTMQWSVEKIVRVNDVTIDGTVISSKIIEESCRKGKGVIPPDILRDLGVVPQLQSAIL